jgi:hypothetical protein
VKKVNKVQSDLLAPKGQLEQQEIQAQRAILVHAGSVVSTGVMEMKAQWDRLHKSQGRPALRDNKDRRSLPSGAMMVTMETWDHQAQPERQEQREPTEQTVPQDSKDYQP